nr:uncharacterized protein LOC123755709 isoform X2 [Procambarus clarkii]
MRDHPSHDAQILGGMWGARWDLGSDPRPHTAHALAALRDTMLREARGQTQRGQDQKILGLPEEVCQPDSAEALSGEMPSQAAPRLALLLSASPRHCLSTPTHHPAPIPKLGNPAPTPPSPAPR